MITEPAKLQDAFALLAERPFDVVAIKEGAVEHERTLATLYGDRGNATFLRDVRPPPQEVLDAARARHRTTPFVVLPEFKDWKYAVIIVPPHATFIEDSRRVSVVSTILSVDATKYLNLAEPMA